MPRPLARDFYAASDEFDAALQRLDAYDAVTTVAVLDYHASTLAGIRAANAHELARPHPEPVPNA